jgi:hypothetical protein
MALTHAPAARLRYGQLFATCLGSPACAATAVHNHSPGRGGELPGLDLVPPELVAAPGWRGGWHDVPAAPPAPACVLAGVARKAVP